jgi:hypothetical protein
MGGGPLRRNCPRLADVLDSEFVGIARLARFGGRRRLEFRGSFGKFGDGLGAGVKLPQRQAPGGGVVLRIVVRARCPAMLSGIWMLLWWFGIRLRATGVCRAELLEEITFAHRLPFSPPARDSALARRRFLVTSRA